MFDAKEMLRRQEVWQASRRLLSWPEKLRLALAMRETVLVFGELRAAARRELPERDQHDQRARDRNAG